MANYIVESKDKAYLVREDGVFEYFYNADTGRFEIGKKRNLPKEHRPITAEQVRVRFGRRGEVAGETDKDGDDKKEGGEPDGSGEE